MPYHVSKERFSQLVEQALDGLPEQFRVFLDQVPVQIMTRPSKHLLQSLGMQDDELLLGLYQGADLMGRAEVEGRGSPVPNHILIFQEDIELVSHNEEHLVREVRTTVLHEIGHHFGMDENDLDELGYG